jgi:hypothetical protein
MATENAISDGMEGAAPKRTQILAEDVINAAHHFPRGFIRESEQQNTLGLHALLQEERDAVGQRAGLARARAGNHQRGSRHGGDGGVLLLVQFARVIDL